MCCEGNSNAWFLFLRCGFRVTDNGSHNFTVEGENISDLLNSSCTSLSNPFYKQ